MLSSLSFKPTPSNSPNPLTRSSIRISLICVLAVFAICLAAATVQPAQASSGSLSTGQVTNQTTVTCPSGHWLPGITCVKAVLAQCANAPDLPFWYGSVMPASGMIQGVIVYFDGGPGEEPVQEGSEYDTLTYYLGLRLRRRAGEMEYALGVYLPSVPAYSCQHSERSMSAGNSSGPRVQEHLYNCGGRR
jgi:hypothetical protein